MKKTKGKDNKQQMTRKQAVAVMYQLRDAYLDFLYASQAFTEAGPFRHQVIDALLVLTEAHYGKPGIEQSVFLCASCLSRYASFSHDGKYRSTSPRLCCSCYQQQKSKSTLPEVVEVL